jgi:hypothetical protein
VRGSRDSMSSLSVLTSSGLSAPFSAARWNSPFCASMERAELPGLVHFSSDGAQLCPELNEVLLALQGQTQLGVVLLAFFGPGDARDQVILEVGPAPRMRDGDVARLKPFVEGSQQRQLVVRPCHLRRFAFIDRSKRGLAFNDGIQFRDVQQGTAKNSGHMPIYFCHELPSLARYAALQSLKLTQDRF